jgi:hypothetical protein
MLSAHAEEQVVNDIQGLVLVDVMDFFPVFKNPAVNMLHYKAVFIVPSLEGLGVLGDLNQDVSISCYLNFSS